MYYCPFTPSRGVAINVFHVVTIIRLTNRNDVVVQIAYFTVFERKIYMVTNTLLNIYIYIYIYTFVSKVKKDNTKNAIERDFLYGPKFGDDLVIFLDARYVQDSKAVLGGFYSIPASVKNKNNVLKGPGLNFSPDEVEVFYLDPSM